MLSISSIAQIRLSRGDSCIIPIDINQGTSMDPVGYRLAEKDSLYFGLMEPNQPFEFAILKKKLTAADYSDDDRLYIRFSSTDTCCLLPGKYYYQVKIKVYDEINDDFIVNTLIPKTEFWIME